MVVQIGGGVGDVPGYYNKKNYKNMYATLYFLKF